MKTKRKPPFLGVPAYDWPNCPLGPGVEAALRIIRTELEAAMALCGCRTVADITSAHVVYRPANVSYVRSAL